MRSGLPFAVEATPFVVAAISGVTDSKAGSPTAAPSPRRKFRRSNPVPFITSLYVFWSIYLAESSQNFSPPVLRA